MSPGNFKMLLMLPGSIMTKFNLNKVVHDYGAILDIGLDNPEQVCAVQAQELAQGFRPGREELRPVAEDPDLADDVTGLCIAGQLHIYIAAKKILTHCSVEF
jgi:hypothetical protein